MTPSFKQTGLGIGTDGRAPGKENGAFFGGGGRGSPQRALGRGTGTTAGCAPMPVARAPRGRRDRDPPAVSHAADEERIQRLFNKFIKVFLN